jgi:hypothetical protein
MRRKKKSTDLSQSSNTPTLGSANESKPTQGQSDENNQATVDKSNNTQQPESVPKATAQISSIAAPQPLMKKIEPSPQPPTPSMPSKAIEGNADKPEIVNSK